MHPNSLPAVLALLAWIPLCSVLFFLFSPVRAITLAYLIGWLALPIAEVQVSGFWNIDKTLATNIGVGLGAALFASNQFRGFKFGAIDILLVVFALGTCITSLENNLGLYDGLSGTAQQLFRYAIPFWFGRAFIRNRKDLHQAARIIVIGASVYAVLAVWEWRMSPQIHRTLYGFFQHSFAQHMRWGFYRPIVCFRHALALGTFFVWTSLLAISMWRSGRLHGLLGAPGIIFMILPVIGLAVSMSFGPWGLFAFGAALLLLRKRLHWRLLIWLPAACAVLWVGGRYSGWTNGEWLSSTVAKVSPDRADSMEGRINAEDLLINHARKRPVFGWGTWGRNRVYDEWGKDLTVTDGLWIILVGSFGLFGLITFYLWWYWPLLMSYSLAGAVEDEPVIMPILIAIALQAVNFLFNAFLSPVLTLMSGAAVGMFLRANYERRALQRAYEFPVWVEPSLAPQPGYTR